MKAALAVARFAPSFWDERRAHRIFVQGRECKGSFVDDWGPRASAADANEDRAERPAHAEPIVIVAVDAVSAPAGSASAVPDSCAGDGVARRRQLPWGEQRISPDPWRQYGPFLPEGRRSRFIFADLGVSMARRERTALC